MKNLNIYKNILWKAFRLRKDFKEKLDFRNGVSINAFIENRNVFLKASHNNHMLSLKTKNYK